MKTHQLVQLPTGLNLFKPTGPTGGNTTKLSREEVISCDLALSDYQDLIQPRFKKWYCKAFYQIGREQFVRIASEARAEGKPPAKLFSYKLKQAMQNVKDQPVEGAVPAGHNTILTEIWRA